MAFTLHVPSLEQLTVTKLAITLWKENFLQYNHITKWPQNKSTEMKGEFIFDAPKTHIQKQFKKIYKEICENIDQLYYPTTLKEKIKNTPLRSVGTELYTWLRSTNYNIKPLNCDTSEIFTRLSKWTVHGKIDIRATAQALSRCKEFTLTDRFEIACAFCIPDAVYDIWLQLPDTFEQGADIWGSIALNFWCTAISDDINPIEMKYGMKLDMLTSAVEFKVLSAVQYFVSLFSKDEKSRAITDSILSIPKCNSHSGERDIIHFFLSQLEENYLVWVFDMMFTRLTVVSYLLEDLNYTSFVTTVFNRVRNSMQRIEFLSLVRDVYQQGLALRSEKLKMTINYLLDNVGPDWRNAVLMNKSIKKSYLSDR